MAQPRKVLIADPELTVVRPLTRALRQRGYQVGYAPDGSKALEVAVLRHPDVILYDEQCTLIEAKNFTQILASNPRTADIPVVLTTGGGDLDVLRSFREGFLRKPYNLDEVLSRIDHLCRRVEAARALKGDAREIEGGLSQLPLADLLQILSANKRTGRLVLLNGQERGEIMLSAGRPANAREGEVEGEKALFRLLGWKEGSFAFNPGPAPAKAKIDRSIEDALLEGARQSDERDRLLPMLPPLSTLVSLSPSAEAPVAPHPVTAAVLNLLQSPHTLRQVLDLVDAPDLEVLSALNALLDRIVISPLDGKVRGAEPILAAAEIHAMRGKILRGKVARAAVVAKVVVAGSGPKAGRALLRTLPGLVGVATEPGCLRSGFGTLGRLELNEALKVDFVLLPTAEAARPLWRPFSHGAIGAIVLEDNESALKLARFCGFELRIPLVLISNVGPGLLSLEQVPPYLRGAAAPVALVDNDFVGALRTLLRTALQPIASESTETVVLRGPEAPG
jgi:CheY-like chemotaxis protein